MKLKAPNAAATTPRVPMNWFSIIFLVAFLTIIYPSSTVAQTGERKLNPAEESVVAQATAGEIADLSKQFPEEKDRKLSAHFLEDLLTDRLPGVKLHRNGVRIYSAIIDEPIDLINAQILCDVWLVRCQFNKEVAFTRTSFAGVVFFNGSAFKADATFGAMKVGSAASFENAAFEGPVNFNRADIASNFVAQGAKFQNKEKGANFSAMKVGGEAFFNNTVFEGTVNFSGANIASEFRAYKATFQKGADFSAMKVRGEAVFENAVFEGPVAFLWADIASRFVADQAKFQNVANFSAMKVGSDADFNKAVFERPVHFSGADIASEFRAQEAKFQNVANFNGMKVRGLASFNSAAFEGPVNFNGADLASEFVADQAKFQNKKSGANFSAMKVGSASFRNTVFEGPVYFSYADFAWLDLSSPFWPKVAAQLHMEGMSYKYIRAAPEEPQSHKALLKLADQSAYTADVYSNLERFFLRQGYRDDADRAFIAGKRRERKENLHGLGWLGSWVLDWLVGYGRRPWQAGIPCAVLVAVGCVLFSPKKMEPQKPEDAPRVYSRFWYSLGLFLPFVDLQADKVWKPKADQTFLRNYMRVHIMLGWILIPIVLAALTGLIK